jgi:DNA-binding response OmpR family regulator
VKILVIEDEHRLAQAIKKGLELEHYLVDVAHDGTIGLDFATSEKFDLIILDIMLPGISGLDICRQLRSLRNHVPVIMLTARTQTEDKIQGLNAGADDYLTKPFAFEELLARIRALLRRPQLTLSPTLKVADLELNPTSYQVSRAGKPIKLSSKEFALLEFFLRHSGQILTKDQIIDHVWSYDSDVLPNTVEVYIRNLRKKIDHPFKDTSPLIHTVRGFGYKIGK